MYPKSRFWVYVEAKNGALPFTLLQKMECIYLANNGCIHSLFDSSFGFVYCLLEFHDLIFKMIA
jgi:hypothetical protein